MPLLNALRAAKHETMYLTDVSKITGSVKRDHYYLTPLNRCEPGMSLTTFNVVSQLIGLHKAAKDFPTTPIVRTIGQ